MKSAAALFIIAAILAGGRAVAEGKAGTGRLVRFLPLGEMPPFRQEIRENVRYELEPPAGSIPPREVLLGFGGNASEATSLALGRLSAPLKAPPGSGPLSLVCRSDAKDTKPWLNLVRPESGDFLVILWRESRQGTWEKVKSLVVTDDAVGAPAGSVRFINVSPASVGILWGEEKLILGGGKLFQRTVPTGKESKFEVQLPDTTGALKRLHSGVILQNPGERSLVLIYSADGVGYRLPLKVTVLREPAPPASTKIPNP